MDDKIQCDSLVYLPVLESQGAIIMAFVYAQMASEVSGAPEAERQTDRQTDRETETERQRGEQFSKLLCACDSRIQTKVWRENSGVWPGQVFLNLVSGS